MHAQRTLCNDCFDNYLLLMFILFSTEVDVVSSPAFTKKRKSSPKKRRQQRTKASKAKSKSCRSESEEEYEEKELEEAWKQKNR